MTIPLYFQIYRSLQDKIFRGEYAPGSLLPAEAALEKMYGTSRAPVRQALSVLENEGLVVRRQGKGTFVSDRARTSPWATGFVKCYERYNDLLTTRTVGVDMAVPGDAQEREFLGTSETFPVIKLTRLKCVGPRPAMLLESYFTPHYDLNVIKAAGDFASLKVLLSEKFSVIVRRAHEKLIVRALEPHQAALLGKPAGTPVLRVRRFLSDSFDKPVMVSNQYVVAPDWEYEADFTLSI